jgi:hypothetical protein
MPERLEGTIEDRQIFVPMDEQRAAGVVDLVADPDIDVLQRLGDVEHAPRVDVEPEAPQQAAEREQVGEEHVPRSARGRARDAREPLAADGLDVSLALSATPRWHRVTRDRAPRGRGAISAATQSSVSDTPGALVQLGRAQLVHDRGDLPRQVGGGACARRATIASSLSKLG